MNRRAEIKNWWNLVGVPGDKVSRAASYDSQSRSRTRSRRPHSRTRSRSQRRDRSPYYGGPPSREVILEGLMLDMVEEDVGHPTHQTIVL